jgi:hypothetical protein
MMWCRGGEVETFRDGKGATIGEHPLGIGKRF